MVAYYIVLWEGAFLAALAIEILNGIWSLFYFIIIYEVGSLQWKGGSDFGSWFGMVIPAYVGPFNSVTMEMWSVV